MGSHSPLPPPQGRCPAGPVLPQPAAGTVTQPLGSLVFCFGRIQRRKSLERMDGVSLHPACLFGFRKKTSPEKEPGRNKVGKNFCCRCFCKVHVVPVCVCVFFHPVQWQFLSVELSRNWTNTQFPREGCLQGQFEYQEQEGGPGSRRPGSAGARVWFDDLVAPRNNAGRQLSPQHEEEETEIRKMERRLGKKKKKQQQGCSQIEPGTQASLQLPQPLTVCLPRGSLLCPLLAWLGFLRVWLAKGGREAAGPSFPLCLGSKTCAPQ